MYTTPARRWAWTKGTHEKSPESAKDVGPTAEGSCVKRFPARLRASLSGVPGTRGFRVLGWLSGVPGTRGFRVLGWLSGVPGTRGFRVLGWLSGVPGTRGFRVLG